jgi:hypothetical protein
VSTCLVCGDPASSGLNLDAGCLDALAGDVATAARLYRELDAALVRPSRPDEGGAKRATSVGINLDDLAVKAREHIRVTLVGWVRVAQEERPKATGWPLDEVADMACWVGRNLTWYAGREWVDEMARTFATTVDEAKAAIQPDRARRMEIGRCPERLTDDEGQDAGVCTGTLFALIRPADSLLPCDIRCTTDGEHRWTADQWHALGRRLNGTGHADLARRVAG